jgi:hypothetical protein
MAKLGTRDRGTFTSADWCAVAVGSVALIAGIALVTVSGTSELTDIGAGLVGLAGIAFVSLAFLLVGEQEERDYRKGSR